MKSRSWDQYRYCSDSANDVRQGCAQVSNVELVEIRVTVSIWYTSLPLVTYELKVSLFPTHYILEHREKGVKERRKKACNKNNFRFN